MKEKILTNNYQLSAIAIALVNRKLLFFSKRALFLAFLFSTLTPSYAGPGVKSFDKQTKNEESISWQLDTIVNKVEFSHSIIECGGKRVVTLKIINNNNYDIKTTWREFFITKQVQKKKEGFAGKREILLAGGESRFGECEQSTNNVLVILPAEVSLSYVAEIEKFEFQDIEVIKSK